MRKLRQLILNDKSASSTSSTISLYKVLSAPRLQQARLQHMAGIDTRHVGLLHAWSGTQELYGVFMVPESILR
jgi:hypothetical protein